MTSVKLPEWAVQSLMLGCLALFWFAMRSDTGQWFSDTTDFAIEMGHLDADATPTLSLHANANANGDIFVVLNTENFRFSKQCLNPSDKGPPVGHAHLYVDGKKQMSVYEPQALLRNMPSGKHVLTATLNVLPNHEFITLSGKPLEQHLTFEVP